MIERNTFNMRSSPTVEAPVAGLERGLNARYFRQRLVAAAHDDAADRLASGHSQRTSCVTCAWLAACLPGLRRQGDEACAG